MPDLGVIDLTMKRGRHFRFRFTIKNDQTALAVPISGSEFAFYAKEALADADVDAIIICTTGNGRIVALDASGGLGEVTITPGDTDDLSLRRHILDAELRETTADGDVVSSAVGTLAILPVAIQATA